MGSFISNFKYYRVVIPCVLLAAALVVIVIFNYRISKATGYTMERLKQFDVYLKNRVAPASKYNMVIMGDSRAMYAASPYVFEKGLGISVFNCGFSSGGHNREVFNHISKNILSAANGEMRVVLLVITPHSLSEDSRKNEHLNSLLAEQQASSWEDYVIELFFKTDIRKRYKRSKKYKDFIAQREVFHANGWHEYINDPSAFLQKKVLESYVARYKKTSFSPQSLSEVVEQTKKWRQENVYVFGYWQPTTPAMEELEMKMSKCDMDGVKRQFTQAGGTWIDIPDRAQYNAFDASHLNKEQALKLSEYICRQIKAHVKGN